MAASRQYRRRLAIEVIGDAATTIRWVASVRTAEVAEEAQGNL
jgi:hypothetical protein